MVTDLRDTRRQRNRDECSAVAKGSITDVHLTGRVVDMAILVGCNEAVSLSVWEEQKEQKHSSPIERSAH